MAAQVESLTQVVQSRVADNLPELHKQLQREHLRLQQQHARTLAAYELSTRESAACLTCFWPHAHVAVNSRIRDLQEEMEQVKARTAASEVNLY